MTVQLKQFLPMSSASHHMSLSLFRQKTIFSKGCKMQRNKRLQCQKAEEHLLTNIRQCKKSLMKIIWVVSGKKEIMNEEEIF